MWVQVEAIQRLDRVTCQDLNRQLNILVVVARRQFIVVDHQIAQAICPDAGFPAQAKLVKVRRVSWKQVENTTGRRCDLTVPNILRSEAQLLNARSAEVNDRVHAGQFGMVPCSREGNLPMLGDIQPSAQSGFTNSDLWLAELQGTTLDLELPDRLANDKALNALLTQIDNVSVCDFAIDFFFQLLHQAHVLSNLCQLPDCVAIDDLAWPFITLAIDREEVGAVRFDHDEAARRCHQIHKLVRTNIFECTGWKCLENRRHLIREIATGTGNLCTDRCLVVDGNRLEFKIQSGDENMTLSNFVHTYLHTPFLWREQVPRRAS